MANLYTKIILYLEDNGKTIDESSDDFRFLYIIQNDSDGKGDYLKAWNDKTIAEPSESTLNSFESAANARESLKEVQCKRKMEYPSIVDQLDKIYHSGVDAWKADIKAIKDKYPKE
jgi:hypothetical protein